MDRDDDFLIKLIIEIMAEIRSNMLVKKYRSGRYQEASKYYSSNNNKNYIRRVSSFAVESQVLKERGVGYHLDKITMLYYLDKNCLEFHLKQFLLEKGSKDSCLILDIDDRDNINLITNNNVKTIIYCSLFRDNILIKKQIKAGRPAVYIKDKNLIIFDGEDELPILATYHLSNLSKSLKMVTLKNYLFIVAFAFAYGVPLYTIRSFFCNYNKLSNNSSQVISHKIDNKKDFIIK